MRIRYTLCRREFESHTGYGICASVSCCGKRIPICVFHDLSANEVSVRQLIRRCNMGRLSLCHLTDVIDDFLAGL